MRISIGEEQSLLKNVYVNDFGDNYHRTEDEPSTELESAARKIRRRYKNITDYMTALVTYQEYMALLAMKHGGPQLFKIKQENDLIDDFIPSKPRMKDNAHNKMLLKNKIMLSRVNVNKVNYEALEESAREYGEAEKDGDLIIDTTIKDPVASKVIKSGLNARGVPTLSSQIQTINFLEEYFMNKNKNIVPGKLDDDDVNISITRIMSEEFDDMVEDTSEEDDVIFYQGNYMNRRTVEDLRVYQDLGERGWNAVKLMKHKGVSKRVTKIVKNQNKTNNKKSKKDKKNKRKNDDFLVSVMLDNEHDSFKDFEEDMLNFSAKNIFGQ